MLGGGAAPKGLAPLLFAHLNVRMAKANLGIERAVAASALASGQARRPTTQQPLSARKSPKGPSRFVLMA